jgi:hypothetical protein
MALEGMGRICEGQSRAERAPGDYQDDCQPEGPHDCQPRGCEAGLADVA